MQGEVDYVTGNVWIEIFLIKYLFHKLLAIVNRFFVGFVNIFTLVKIRIFISVVRLVYN